MLSENQLKVCTKCLVGKPLGDFPPRKDSPNATHRSRCKKCHYEVGREKHSETQRIAGNRWKKINRERVNAQQLARRNKNPEKYREAVRRSSQKVPREIRASRTRAREARVRNQQPAWADKKRIRWVYKLARILTDLTEIEFQVDHIVPIKSKIVSGLHVHSNLQILTKSENSSKNNRYWPQMAGK